MLHKVFRKNNAEFFAESGMVEQMHETVARFVGERLTYRRLIAYNGLSSAARSE